MKRKVAIGAGGLLLLLIGFFLLSHGRAPAPQGAGAHLSSSFEVGITTAQEVRNMLAVYGARVESTEKELAALRSLMEEGRKSSEETRKKDVSGLERMIDDLKAVARPETAPPPPPPGSPRFRTFEFEKRKGGALHVPAGSFGEATLLTGVFAPTTGEALPVLLRLDAALTGPQKSRVPIRGAFLVGKAQGDANSRRATVQIETLSVVRADGTAVETKVNGWVADDDGLQGLRGVYVWRADEIVALASATGALAGGAEALGQRETTAQVTPLGGIQGTVTGDPLKFAGYRSLSTAFARLGEMMTRRLDEIVPAIHVANARRVTVAFISGATLEGCEAPEIAASPFEGLDR